MILSPRLLQVLFALVLLYVVNSMRRCGGDRVERTLSYERAGSRRAKPVDQQVLTTRQPVALYDVRAEPGFQYPTEAAREGIRSVLVVPLTLRDQPVGVMRVYSAQPHRFTPEEAALIAAVADMGTIAFENARLHESLDEKYQQSWSDWSGWFRCLVFS